MSQIRSKSSVSHGAINGVAVDAGSLLENKPAGRSVRIVLGEFLLLLHPAVEVLTRVYIDAEQHLCMLGAAVLGALAQKQPGALRLDPHRVHLVGDEVCLAGQTRHPETVHDVCRTQIEESWQSVATLTDGYVQLIGCYNAQPGIS